MATKKDAPQVLDQPSDDQWTVPKLVGLIILTLGGFFVFIWNATPFYHAGPIDPSTLPTYVTHGK